MMTCALGGVMLLFLLTQGSTRAQIKDIVEDSDLILVEAREILPQQFDATARILERFRDTAREIGSGLVGLPRLQGDVLFLLDYSGSVVCKNYSGNAVCDHETPKKREMLQLVELIMAANAGIERVSAVAFDNEVYDIPGFAEWPKVGMGRDRSQLVEALERESQIGGGGTDLRRAILDGVRKAAARPGTATVVLISDGISELGFKLGPEMFVERLNDELDQPRRAREVVLHTVGLLGYEGTFDPDAPIGQRFENQAVGAADLGKFLQALAASWGGNFLGLPVQTD